MTQEQELIERLREEYVSKSGSGINNGCWECSSMGALADEAADMIEALSRQLEKAREVKPLSWGRAEADGMNLQADCPFGRYYIALRPDGNWFWWRPASSPAHQGCENSEDDAKNAAQADYQRRYNAMSQEGE